MDANSVGERIRRARMSSGLQGKALAETVGISRPYLTQIERGLRTPASDLLTRLANVLQVTPQWLLHGTHPPNSESPEKIDPAVRIADLERQLAIAQDTINNLSKALAQGRPVAEPASGACGGGKHAASDWHERRAGA